MTYILQVLLLFTGQLMQERSEVHKVGVDTIALHPSQALVATGGADRLIKLWPHQSQVSSDMTGHSLILLTSCLQTRCAACNCFTQDNSHTYSSMCPYT